MTQTKTGARLRPMLFSTAMVQAILDGRKTQTRRVVKPQPGDHPNDDGFMSTVLERCPYGQPGDVIWVRESFCPDYFDDRLPCYKADWSKIASEYVTEPKWKPSIHMPFAAARIFLRVKSVRVERLQDISEDDAFDEGVEIKTIPNADAGDYNCYPRNYMANEKQADGWPYYKEEEYIKSFASLWQSINGPESWEANPWVWVVEFERIAKEEATQ